ncbi:hypothetical protein VM98_34025, partial [Streptomyces rubellomurinus subsp. indigoferus]
MSDRPTVAAALHRIGVGAMDPELAPEARRVGAVQFGEGPAAVGGQGREGVDAVGDAAPQVLGARDAAGEAAAHGDDGVDTVSALPTDRG